MPLSWDDLQFFLAVSREGQLSRAARVLGWLADAAFVVPGTVLALAMILVYLPPLPGIDYRDARRGVHRWARLDGDRLDACLFLSFGPTLPAREWLVGLFDAPSIDTDARCGLLSGRAPAGRPDEGRVVCACFDVGLNRIARAIRDGGLTSAEQVGAALKAGTNCGSCIPELKELIADARRDQAA